MKSVELQLRCGHFRIDSGNEYAAQDAAQPFLCYTENDIWHAVCRPDNGVSYNAKIVLAGGKAQENITITAETASVVSEPLRSGIISVDLTDSSAEFDVMRARRIIFSLGRGSANLKAKPAVGAEFRCGSGRLDIFLAKNPRGYLYNTVRGAGNVIINSIPARRRSSIGSPGGIPININCGLGTVNITEY